MLFSLGRTPLAIACRNKQLALSKKLIAKGADASTRDDTSKRLEALIQCQDDFISIYCDVNDKILSLTGTKVTSAS